MTNIAYIITASGIAAVINGEQYTLTSDNPSYGEVLSAIQNNERPARIAELFRTANAVKRYLQRGNVKIDVQNGELLYKGEALHNVVVDRIIEFMRQGLEVEPLVKFLERLMANPSKRAIDELYTFLEHKHLPITPNGTFLAYKGVNDNYTDRFTGKFINRPGTVHEMARNLVDDDARRGCSNGFHVGSLEYATGFGSRTVICEIDPADVVSVPHDCECQKLRTAKYRVLCDYNGPLPGVFANASTPYGG